MPSEVDSPFAATAGLDGDSPRLLSTASFLKEVGVAGGLRKEVQGFAERWIYGRGTPHIRAAFQWHRRALCRSCPDTSDIVWFPLEASHVEGPRNMAFAPTKLADHQSMRCHQARCEHVHARRAAHPSYAAYTTG